MVDHGPAFRLFTLFAFAVLSHGAGVLVALAFPDAPRWALWLGGAGCLGLPAFAYGAYALVPELLAAARRGDRKAVAREGAPVLGALAALLLVALGLHRFAPDAAGPLAVLCAAGVLAAAGVAWVAVFD